jgi:penicillin-binding protein 2
MKENKNDVMGIFRIRIYTAVVLILFSVLCGRLWYLQIIQGHTYLVQSEENRIRLLRIKSPRGIISDADGFALVRNRPSFNVFLIREDVEALGYTKTEKQAALEETAERLEELLPISKDDIITKVKNLRDRNLNRF